jgi:hypothetical protein
MSDLIDRTHLSKFDNQKAIQELERRIVYGLAREWEIALGILAPAHQKLMRMPLFSIRDLSSKWGYWSSTRNEICISRQLVLNYPWDSVREILLHEMAHQFTAQVFGDMDKSPHGSLFKQACYLLRANPKASGAFRPLRDRIQNPEHGVMDRLMVRIKKLLALAESRNRYEAEAAMLKAHELIAKYNVDLLDDDQNGDLISVFLGQPALRHLKEEYYLANLLQDFYFIRAIWVSAFVLDKEKMGRVLEISGTAKNIKLASYVYDFIRRYIDSQWMAYNKTRSLNRYRKSDFAVGIIEGFRTKLTSYTRQNKKMKNYFAVIQKTDSALEHYFAYKYPHTANIRKAVSDQHQTILKDGKKLGKQLVIAKGITSSNKGKVQLIGP